MFSDQSEKGPIVVSLSWMSHSANYVLVGQLGRPITQNWYIWCMVATRGDGRRKQ